MKKISYCPVFLLNFVILFLLFSIPVRAQYFQTGAGSFQMLENNLSKINTESCSGGRCNGYCECNLAIDGRNSSLQFYRTNPSLHLYDTESSDGIKTLTRKYFLDIDINGQKCTQYALIYDRGSEISKEPTSDQPCIFRPISSCCCKTTGSGSLTTERVCEQVYDDSGSFNCTAQIAGDAQDGPPKDFTWVILPLKEGGCSAYEKEVTEYVSGAGVAIGDIKNLQSKAKSLNKLFGGELTGTQGVNMFIGRMIVFLMGAIGSLLLLFYVYAGVLWMTANGNAEQITKAKHIMVWATLGLIFDVSSYLLVKALFDFLFP